MVPVDPAVGWVVAPAVGLVVGTDVGPEEDAAAVWSALREVQPVTAKAAMTTAVVMIRTGRMVIPPNSYDPVSPGHHQPRLGRSQHGHRSTSRQPRTGLNPVAIIQPMRHPALSATNGSSLVPVPLSSDGQSTPVDVVLGLAQSCRPGAGLAGLKVRPVHAR
jgi:hypothetical protein